MTNSIPGECHSYCQETLTCMLYIAGRGDLAAGQLCAEDVNSFCA